MGFCPLGYALGHFDRGDGRCGSPNVAFHKSAYIFVGRPRGGIVKLKLLTAILMSLAAAAWLASALLVPSGEGTMTRWLIVIAFSALAVFYWMAYFRLKNSTSGTE
jgi:hypothetical protein